MLLYRLRGGRGGRGGRWVGAWEEAGGRRGRGPRRGWREMGGGGAEKKVECRRRARPASARAACPRGFGMDRLPTLAPRGPSAPGRTPARRRFASHTHARKRWRGGPAGKKKMQLTPKTLPRWKRCRPTAGTGPRRPPFGSHCVWWRAERGKVEVRRAGAEGRRRRRHTGESGRLCPHLSTATPLSPRVVKPQRPAVLQGVGFGGVAGGGVVGHDWCVCVCVCGARAQKRETGRERPDDRLTAP
jgi:hypothetical protein